MSCTILIKRIKTMFFCFPLTERDSGHESVPPPQHCVLLHLLCGKGRAVAGHEAAQWW